MNAQTISWPHHGGCFRGGERDQKTGERDICIYTSMQFAVFNLTPALPSQTNKSLVKTGDSPVCVFYQTMNPLRTGAVLEAPPNCNHRVQPGTQRYLANGWQESQLEFSVSLCQYPCPQARFPGDFQRLWVEHSGAAWGGSGLSRRQTWRANSQRGSFLAAGPRCPGLQVPKAASVKSWTLRKQQEAPLYSGCCIPICT